MDGATDVIIVVGPVSAVSLGSVEDEGAVVLTHVNSAVVSLEDLAAEAIEEVSGVLSIIVRVCLELKDSIRFLILMVATLEELHVLDDSAGVGTFLSLAGAVFALEVDRLLVSAFPGRENEGHVISIQAVAHRFEVF